MRDFVLPESQRRTLDELTDDLDLHAGDGRAKRSAFWIMLTLSACIASAGVIGDSTATVIGAMIVAPLSTPIMGVALGVAKRRRTGSLRYVVGGALWVILLGVLFSLLLPDTFQLATNSQISGRTSPGLPDLVAAVATGLAGAIAYSRRDVATVLPGVAIAISLVPPLAVVGVCLGEGAFTFAAGALLLFVSNLLALVLAGTIVYAALRYSERREDGEPASLRRAYLAIGGLFAVVAVPLVANTVATALLSSWGVTVRDATEDWLADVPGATVTDVTHEFVDYTVDVRVAGGELPPAQDLLDSLEGRVPNGVLVTVRTTVGSTLEVGAVGG
ncbi:DUF389 domain-containing protein [Cellulomonas sp. DKR-3]|uniref:DUF389 domain-containing protein n=1 Tax=Cellulomonas fulva TaxID=2835530 RepID=A0ABS5TXS2_9CELL|nr:DUF389 domain-containing protein [Cellulomonas fulva]